MRQCWMMGFAFACGIALPFAVMAAGPAKATHTLEPFQVELVAARPSGEAWDTGIGAFTRPDPQVTLMRHDEAALREVVELLIVAQEKRFKELEQRATAVAQEKRFKELGRPVPAQFKTLMARSAMQTLRCGVTLEALQDQTLTKARAQLFADTEVVKDSILAKLSGGALKVSVGDKLTIFVNDVDIAAHDLMGETELVITKELLAKGEVELKFNSVESLRLKFKQIKK